MSLENPFTRLEENITLPKFDVFQSQGYNLKNPKYLK